MSATSLLIIAVGLLTSPCYRTRSVLLREPLFDAFRRLCNPPLNLAPEAVVIFRFPYLIQKILYSAAVLALFTSVHKKCGSLCAV